MVHLFVGSCSSQHVQTESTQSQHAKESMLFFSVVHKRCGHPGCMKQPSYGHAGNRKAEFWSPHAKEGMMDVRRGGIRQRSRLTV
ncbi:unnamed protein product [Ectocarpus sp. 4 AP-2014]